MSVWEALGELDRSQPRLGEQLMCALREAIRSGRLAPGSRLPSTRDLAADLGVSRGLVVGAYEGLVAEGRLIARPGSGTVVALPVAALRVVEPHVRPRPPAVAAVPAPPTGAVVPLRPGVPDLGLFPRTQWRRAYERALTTAADVDFDYPDPAGAFRLRAELAAYLARNRAAQADVDRILVTGGSAQGIALVAGALRANGVNRLALEDPASVAVRSCLAAHGIRPVPVPVDGSGVDVAALERSKARAVLVTPAHQYPTGVVLAPERRTRLLDWARRTGGLVVEDDYDAEFRYDREPVGCLQGLAPESVVLVGSASRVLAPALRLGWLVVPGHWRDALCTAKLAADRGGPTMDQLALAELLAGGGYDRHLRRARRTYRERREALVAALRRVLPAVQVLGVAAGLHLTVELPPGSDDTVVVERAWAAGLGPLAGSKLRAHPGGSPTLVLGYGAHSPPELIRAVRALARVISLARVT